MTDIRGRLVDALRKHRRGRGPACRRCNTDYEAENYTDHLADVLLSLPGIAIVDTETDIERVAKVLCNGYFDADDGWDRCVVEYGRELWRRAARAALLAAAVQAQEEQ